ncbi:MAG: hypothetical protein HYW91_03590 [Candidatus Sungbacteria bacterium]|nr:hypothetical protein [Candidatus Sungbacteria bacterium]
MRFWPRTAATIDDAMRAAVEYRIGRYNFMNGGGVYLGPSFEGPTAEIEISTPMAGGACRNPADHSAGAHITLPTGRNWCTWCEGPVL